jgi:hypothetical protein
MRDRRMRSFDLETCVEHYQFRNLKGRSFLTEIFSQDLGSFLPDEERRTIGVGAQVVGTDAQVNALEVLGAWTRVKIVKATKER